jgi:rhamnosyltransferase
MLGPSVENFETGEEYKSVIHKEQVTDIGFIPRREIISSGSCTTIECLKEVGLNDGRLFIDYVDFEWCWRANSKGYVCGITSNLSISHHVGQKTINLFGYLIIISAPGRYFYQFRNYLWLIRRNYVPLQWKIAMGIKSVARLIYFPLCIPSGVACWKNMLKGIRAGL